MKKFFKGFFRKKKHIEPVAFATFPAKFEGLSIDFEMKGTKAPVIKISNELRPTGPLFSEKHREQLEDLENVELEILWLTHPLTSRAMWFLEEFFRNIDVQSVTMDSGKIISVFDNIFSFVMSTKVDLKRIAFTHISRELSGEVFMNHTKERQNIKYIDLRGISFNKSHKKMIHHFKLHGENIRNKKTDLNATYFYLCRSSVKYRIFSNLISLEIGKASLSPEVVVGCLYSISEEPFSNQLKVFQFDNTESLFLYGAKLYALSKFVVSFQKEILLKVPVIFPKPVDSALLLNSLLCSKEFIQYVIERAKIFQAAFEESFNFHSNRFIKVK
eukprot:snap_masked-scaffold_30-processed-gene-1.24-mRNA-1 protein AED:1.00 eAED:1.00 QI:0/0/0/0/1/1/2/0/329